MTAYGEAVTWEPQTPRIRPLHLLLGWAVSAASVVAAAWLLPGVELLEFGGGFRFGPYGINHPASRAYEPGTNVLVSSWHTAGGWAEVREALTLGPRRGPDAEEFDTATGRHLGNFPQAFSHLALLEAAARIILAERLEELA